MVDQEIAHACNAFPGYLAVRFLVRLRQVLNSLADDLQVSDHGVLRLGIGEESISSACGVLKNPVQAVANMCQIDAIATHSGLACARICSSR